jgi:hypothetical protein
MRDQAKLDQRAELLVKVGQQAFGRLWQITLSRATGRPARSIRRWVARAQAVPDDFLFSIPEGIRKEARLLAARSAELKRIANDCERWIREL